mgnify:CR=1 FL=1
MTIKPLVIVMICLLMAIGCATLTPLEEAQQLLVSEDYDSALKILTEMLKADSESVTVLRQLGIVYYKKENYDQAIDYFNQVLSRKPDDGGTILYLGLVYELQNNEDQAIQAYQRYTEVAPLSSTKKKIEIRLKALVAKRMTRLAKQALVAEAAGNYPQTEPNTVAVMYFDNSSSNPELEPLRKGLTDLLISDLSQVKSLKVVERTRMQKLLQEMELAEQSIIDAETAPRTGRLLGAAQVVKGNFTSLSESGLMLNATCSQIETSQIDQTEPLQGPQVELFEMEKALVFSILDTMKISITPEEEAAIQKRPTENFMAFMAYSRGIDLVDRGDYAAASQAFSQAVELDPGFSQAEETLSDVEEINMAPAVISAEPEAAVEQVEAVAASETPAAAAPTTGMAAAPNALAEVDAIVSKDFIPQPAAAGAAPIQNQGQTRGGGSDQQSPAATATASRKISIDISWEQ